MAVLHFLPFGWLPTWLVRRFSHAVRVGPNAHVVVVRVPEMLRHCGLVEIERELRP